MHPEQHLRSAIGRDRKRRLDASIEPLALSAMRILAVQDFRLMPLRAAFTVMERYVRYLTAGPAQLIRNMFDDRCVSLIFDAESCRPTAASWGRLSLTGALQQ